MRIGVTPYCHDGDITRPYVPEGYRIGITERHGEMVVFHYTMTNEALLALLDTVDGFVFSGGPDVDPTRYGRKKKPECGEINPRRDEVEFMLFEHILQRDMPVLAICRGHQMVNVALGGTLVQHVDGHHQHDAAYHHDIRLAPDSRLREIVGSDRALVNSYHHQCVDDLAESLQAVAWSDEGIIEASVRPASRFFSTYQWHPEVLLHNDTLSNRIFDDFISACSNI